MEISLGYLASTVDYRWKKMIRDYNLLEWKSNIREKYMVINYKGNNLLELRITQDCLDKYFILSNSNVGLYFIVLPLKTSPRCSCVKQSRWGPRYERILNFAEIDASCLADSSALYLRFHSQNSLAACVQFLIHIMKLDCHKGSINCNEMLVHTLHFNHILSDYWSSYAFQLLLTLGYRIKNRITKKTLRKIIQLSNIFKQEQYPNHECYLKLISVYYRARHNRFFDINREFDSIQTMPAGIILDKWAYVPRVYLTPYGVVPLTVKPMRGNRILREQLRFGPAEHFCRVIIRDVDLGQPQKDFMQITEQWIKKLIMAANDVIVGNKRFYFLLCSNSQLRDRSFWFHSPYQGCGVEDIRRWMGDFSSETCIGTRIARMALSLTGTTPTIKVNTNSFVLVCNINIFMFFFV
jgi:hypothetical protein